MYSMEQKHTHDIVLTKSHAQEDETADARLLLDLPQDVLRLIIRHVDQGKGGKKMFYENVPCIIALFTQLRHVCKMLEQKLSMPNELKNILNLNQVKLDLSLNYYSWHKSKKELGFVFFKSLIAMGANPSSGFAGNTCLHSISFGDNDDLNYYLAEFYIKHGVNVNQINDKGETPLHTAAFKGQEDVVEALLKHNAQLDVKDKQGDTPIDIASKFNKPKILELFQKHGIDVSSERKLLNQINAIANLTKTT